MNNEFTQNNEMVIKEGKNYRTLVGDLVKVKKIDVENNTMIIFNISEQCNTWCRIDAAIKDNKMRHEG
jgi:ribosomal protein L21